MICTPDTRWKYLREDENKYFNKNRNTSLKEYLTAIFPNNQFEYGYRIQKIDIPDALEFHRFICDAMCKELKIIVEFDGVNHYMDTQICLNDLERDKWFIDAGYKVVRIPFWIQLSNNVIKTLFNVEIPTPMCQLDYNFYNPEENKVNYNILPGNMCELGRKRFVEEFDRFDTETQKQIYRDLKMCEEHVDSRYKEELLTTVFPEKIRSHMVFTIAAAS